MKKKLLFLVFFALTLRLGAQLPDGSIAPDWTLTDINGNTHHLYAYLDSGYTVFLDFSATWCGPCWSYHNSGALEGLYNQYGPGGTNEVRVFFIEGDPTTGIDCLYGQPTCPSSQGNWVDGTPYPIINDASQNGPYNINYFPTIYGICPDYILEEVGQQSTAGLYAWMQNNCATASSLTITVNSVQNASCYGFQDGAIDISVSGGSGSYSFNWSSGQTTEDIAGVPAGTYFVTVTDNQMGMTAVSDPITVGEPSELVLTQDTYQPVSCAGNDGAVAYSVSGGTPSYFYNWSTGDITPGLTGLAPGTYSLTVTDANGCSATDIVVFADPDVPMAVVNQNPDPITCASATTTVDGSGSSQGPDISYQWTTTNGIIVSGANTPIAVVASDGTYTLTVVNTTNGCSASASVTVESDMATPSVSATGGTLTCANQSVTLMATSDVPNAFYFWTGPNGYTSQEQNPVVSTPGQYTVVVTDPANGCTSATSVMVDQDDTPPTLSIAASGMLTCGNPTVTLTATTSASNPQYMWSGPNNFSSNENPVTVSLEGTYFLTIVDQANQCSASAQVDVAADQALPDISATASGAITCASSTVALTATSAASGATFSWSGPGSFSATGASVVVNLPGTYVVLVTDPANGCQNEADVFVPIDTLAPDVTATASGSLNCNTTAVTLTATANANSATFAWSGPNGFTASGASVQVSTAGTYSVTATDTNNGCTGSADITVTYMEPPIVNCTTVSNVTTAGGSDGVGSATPFGGVPPYVVVLSNGMTQNVANSGDDAVFSGLSAGSYIVTVYDNIQCSATCAFSISEPGCNLTLSGQVMDESCADANDGSIFVSPDGAIGSVTYVWNNGLQGSTIDGLAAGTYTVTATDESGCTATLTLTVNTTQQVTPFFEPIGPFCADAGPVALPDVSLNGISGTWSVNPFNPANGSQDVVFTPDPGQCATTFTMSIEVIPLPTVSAGSYDTLCVDGGTIDLAGTPAGGTFSGPGVSNNTFDPTVAGIGVHQIVYTYQAASGCAGSDTTTLVVLDCGSGDCQNPPTVDAGSPITICAGETAQLSGSFGGGATMITWSGGNGTFDPDANTPNASYTPNPNEVAQGTVILVITTDDPDGNGPCLAAVDEVEITIQPVPDVSAGSYDTLCVDDGAIDLAGTPAGGTFSGPGVSNNTFNPAVAGVGVHTIAYTYQGAAGCAATASTIIVVIDCGSGDCQNPPTVDAGSEQWACANNANYPLMGTIGGSATSATWSGGDGSYIPDNQSLNTVYVASASEIAAGTIVLYLETNDPDGSGPCQAAIDSVILHVNPIPDVYIPDTMICNNDDPIILTGTPAGGTFAGPGISNNTFDPSLTGTGTFTITYTYMAPNACSNTDTASIQVIDCTGCDNPPTISLGTDQVTSCGFIPVPLTATLGGDATEVYWSGGQGSFDPNADTTSVEYIPTPDEVAAGMVTLTATTNDPDGSGPCQAASANVTIVFESIEVGIEVSGQLCCTNDTIALLATASCPNALFSWSGPGGDTGLDSILHVTYVGIFSVTVSCPNGCTTTKSVEVEPCEPISGVEVNVSYDTGFGMATVDSILGGTAPFTFTWMQNGDTLASGTNPKIEDLPTGDYVVIVTDANGCEWEEPFQVIVGVDEPDWAAGLGLYPNPTMGAFTVRLADARPARISVSDAIGQPVVEVKTSQRQAYLDLVDLPPGVYIVRIEVNHQAVYRRLTVAR